MEQAFGRWFADGLYRGLVSSATQAISEPAQNILNWFIFFQTGLNFFKPVFLSTIQKGKISLYLPLSYSPILNEYLPIYFIPQLPYPLPQNPIKYEY